MHVRGLRHMSYLRGMILIDKILKPLVCSCQLHFMALLFFVLAFLCVFRG